MAAVALSKAIDIHGIEAQVSSLRSVISCEAFVADVAKIKDERSSKSTLVLDELGLGETWVVTPKCPEIFYSSTVLLRH